MSKKIAAKQARDHHTFELDNFYWEVLFAHAEYLKVAKHRFFRLGVAINPDTEEVASILPIQPALKKTQISYHGLAVTRVRTIAPLKH